MLKLVVFIVGSIVSSFLTLQLMLRYPSVLDFLSRLLRVTPPNPKPSLPAPEPKLATPVPRRHYSQLEFRIPRTLRIEELPRASRVEDYVRTPQFTTTYLREPIPLTSLATQEWAQQVAQEWAQQVVEQFEQAYSLGPAQVTVTEQPPQAQPAKPLPEPSEPPKRAADHLLDDDWKIK